jgi:putative hemolysin
MIYPAHCLAGFEDHNRSADITEAPFDGSRFRVAFARDASDVLEAQRLRWRVYRESLHADLPAGGVDADDFDRFCDHLLVRDSDTDAIVGTYRILTPERARQAGGYYSETEFDIGRIVSQGARVAEVGRACVHPAYRTGGVITLLLAGLTAHLVEHACEYVIGCASVSLADGAGRAASICRRLTRDHASPVEWQAFPRARFPFESIAADDAAPLPPLIKAYLRLGATVCSEPAWDEQFKTADLLLILAMARMAPRYRSRLLRQALSA